jgi:hypothetical protein
VFYSFTVKGFESTPLDLALHLNRPGESSRVPVEGFYRERDAELLYVPLTEDDPPGTYELIIDLTLPENGGDPANGRVICRQFDHTGFVPHSDQALESPLIPGLGSLS